MSKGETGVSMGGAAEVTPAAKKRWQKRLRAEEKKWAQRAGAVRKTTSDALPPSSKLR
jgi:hypothetical protein